MKKKLTLFYLQNVETWIQTAPITATTTSVLETSSRGQDCTAPNSVDCVVSVLGCFSLVCYREVLSCVELLIQYTLTILL